MDQLIKDLRFGVRSLLKRPGFTAIAVLTLGLGIGANTAIFSVVNATLMQPLPVQDPERLVFVFNGPSQSIFSYPDYAALRDSNNVFDGLAAWGGITASLNRNDQPDLVNGAIVTGNFFDVIGVRAQLGRVLSTEDDNLLRYTRTQGREFYRQAVEKVEAIPGVEAASLARIAAVSGNSSVRSLLIEGRAGSDNQFRNEGSGPAPGDDQSVRVKILRQGQ